MRRLLIRLVIPTLLCLLPVVGAIVVVVAIPPSALRDYATRLKDSPMDWLILGLGLMLFLAQTRLSWKAMQWRGRGFDERGDKILSSLAQAAEWFPLLGLLGTVAAILQTFGTVGPGVTPQEIIKKYAPAITATGSGLFAALINILPTWIVTVGREWIASLAGEEPGLADISQAASAKGGGA